MQVLPLRGAPALRKKRAQRGRENKKCELRKNAVRIGRFISTPKTWRVNQNFGICLKSTRSMTYPSAMYCEPTTVTDRMGMAGRLSRMPDLQHESVAFLRALAVRARSRLMRRGRVIEGRKLVLDAERPEDRPAVLVVLMTVERKDTLLLMQGSPNLLAKGPD